MEHRIVAHFVGTRDAITNPYDQRDAIRAGIDLSAIHREHWLSIAFMSLSPFAPSWFQMFPRDMPRDMLDIEEPIVALQAINGCLT